VKERTPPPAPAAESVLARVNALLRQGERAAARALLLPLERSGGPAGRAALVELAALDEEEGRFDEAIRRWQTVLADEIDDEVAWANLERLGREPDVPTAPATGAAAPTLESGAGVRVSRFEILAELGRGAFATVYRARDRQLGLELALKVLHPRTSLLEGEKAFFAEARKAAGLRHPGIVAIYDIDPAMRTVVMELVRGGTLRDRLRARGASPLPAAELSALARRLVTALFHLHAHDIVHGDLSPRNILLRAAGDPVLIDFGGARLGAADDQPAGTPLYLAPEQFTGTGVSEAADLFAAGAVLWEATALSPMRAREDLLAGRTAARPLPASAVEAQDPSDRARLRAIAELIAALTQANPDHRARAAHAALARMG
jgi:eukaryotic-like serine/threonine-protein kinase